MERGAHITKVVREREEVVAVPRIHEEVTGERVPLNRMVDAPVAMRQEGDTLIIPLWERSVVVEKRLSVQEEIRITTRRIEEYTSQPVTLRRAEGMVERLSPSEQQPLLLERSLLNAKTLVGLFDDFTDTEGAVHLILNWNTTDSSQ